MISILRDNVEIGTLSTAETEPISNASFAALIAENPNMLLARVQTRDRKDFRKKYVHYYAGPNLIKILFATMQLPTEQILRSRYHPEFPLTAKDPLTNEIIVGEVGFYKMVSNEAHYFGSDFNYANSKQFRDEFSALTADKPLIDVGFREEQQGPNQINLVVPIHYSDKKALTYFMTTI